MFPGDELVEVNLDGVTYQIPKGTSLLELTSDPEMPIPFGCFSGRCGVCRIRITEGVENLNALSDLEEAYADGELSPTERLACQCCPTGFIRASAI